MRATLDRFRPLVRPGDRPSWSGEPVGPQPDARPRAGPRTRSRSPGGLGRARPAPASSATSSPRRRFATFPLNGRNYTDLAFLQPGVIAFPYRDGGSVVAHGLAASVNGQDPRSNVYLLDGTLMNDFTNGPAGSAAGHHARHRDRARVPGRGERLRRRVRPQLRRPDQRRHEVRHQRLPRQRLRVPPQRRPRRPQLLRPRREARLPPQPVRRSPLGGPVRNDRTFFFVGYEGLRERLGRTISTVVPERGRARGDPARARREAPSSCR